MRVPGDRGGDWGGCAIASTAGPFTLIEDCVFESNESGDGLTGAISILACDQFRINRCTFRENVNPRGWGAAISFFQTQIFLDDCIFVGNAAGSGGAVYDWGNNSSCFFERCLLTGNYASDLGGGGGAYGSVGIGSCRFTQCTLSGNTVEGMGGALYLGPDADAEMEASILWGNCSRSGASGDDYYGLDGTTVQFFCCAVDREGVEGPEGGIEYLGDQVETDPLFCDPRSCLDAPTSEGDHSLHADSPCLEHPPCGQIGVLGVGCAPTALRPASWGWIKERFR